MSEKMPKRLLPEEIQAQEEAKLKVQQEKENTLGMEIHFDLHPEQLILPESLRESEPEIKEFNTLIESFESTHSLSELSLIVDLTPAEAPNHSIREPARLDLIPIVSLLNTLKKETNISEEKHNELFAKYKILSRAVGIMSNNKIDHTR